MPIHPPHPTATTSRAQPWPWVVVAIAALMSIGHANNYTLSVDMLPCENRLIFYPRMTSTPGQDYTTTLSARVVSQDQRGSTFVAERSFAKDNGRLDLWSDVEPFVAVDWNTLTAPHLQFVDPGGNEVGWFRIPTYQAVAFAGGSGATTDPYLIATATQLQHVACRSGSSDASYYRLTRDIDLSGRRFLPLGAFGSAFKGGFDGGGHSIRNMTIELPQMRYSAFIGYAEESFIRDVRFVNPTVIGYQFAAIVVGFYPGSNRIISITNTAIDDGLLIGAGMMGGLFGDGSTRVLLADTHVDLEVRFGVPSYHGSDGPFASSDLGLATNPFTAVGGLVGTGSEITVRNGTADVRLTMDPRLLHIETLHRTGGLMGRPRNTVTVDGFDARVSMDLTVQNIFLDRPEVGCCGQDPVPDQSSSGLFGGRYDRSLFANATAFVDITIRAAGTNDAKVLESIGGITGHAKDSTFTGVDVRGSVTLDTRASQGPVTVRQVGGAIGLALDSPVAINESHVDVDVIILANPQDTVEGVGGLVGNAMRLLVHDVRVDGRIVIDANASRVGGLIGSPNVDTGIRRILSGVIYRGEGIQAGPGSTNVGALWGFDATGMVQGASVFWDRHRNGVSTFDENELGRPARSSELGDITWLTDNGFDPDAWCVTTEDGVSVPAVKRLTPACGGGNDGGNDGGVITLPTAPTTLTATPGNTTATLTWVAPTGVIDTYVIQSRTPGSNWRTQSTTPCDTPTCAIATNLTNAQPTDFRIAAENQAGRGPWSNVITITPGTTPTAPGSLTAAPGDATATLTWTPPTDDGGYPITSYTIEITNTIGGAWTPITGEPCSATCTTITDLANGTTVAFRIAATNTIGKGPWSNVTTTQPNPTPTAPTNLTATPGDAQVTLTWQAPSTGSNPTYQIDVSNDAGSIWTPANATPCNPASPTCAIIGGLTNGTPYTFRITATTTAGSSPAAGPVLATPQAPTDVPVITRVIPGPNRAWLIIATPTPTTTGHEISLDAGNTWQTITPHVGDRVIRITGLSNATTYPIQLRTLRTDGTRSPATPTITVMPNQIRIAAPSLTTVADANTLTIDRNSGVTTFSVELIFTNEGASVLHDTWLQWPSLPAGTVITGVDVIEGSGDWFALDDWWYGESVDVAPGATHRVRVSLETQP
jgi:hypothetical protein